MTLYEPRSTPSQKQHGLLQAFSLALGVLLLEGCEASETKMRGASQDAAATRAQSEEHRMWMIVGERRFAITLANTNAGRAFAARLPLTLDMTDLNANEKKSRSIASTADECESTRDDSHR